MVTNVQIIQQCQITQSSNNQVSYTTTKDNAMLVVQGKLEWIAKLKVILYGMGFYVNLHSKGSHQKHK